MSFFKLFSITVFVLTILACSTEDTESDYIKTQGMWASIKINSNGVRTRIVAELNVGGSNGTNISLSKEDKLTATVGGLSKLLKKDIDFLDIDYQTYFDITADDTLFNIALLRIKETDADKSEVKLPVNFNIYSPQSAQSYTVNNDISLDWDHLSEHKKITLLLINTCTNNQGNQTTLSETFQISDDGNHLIQLSELNMYQDDTLDKNIDCLLSIKLIRETQGQVDPTFSKGSKITAQQTREIKGITIDI